MKYFFSTIGLLVLAFSASADSSPITDQMQSIRYEFTINTQNHTLLHDLSLSQQIPDEMGAGTTPYWFRYFDSNRQEIGSFPLQIDLRTDGEFEAKRHLAHLPLVPNAVEYRVVNIDFSDDLPIGMGELPFHGPQPASFEVVGTDSEQSEPELFDDTGYTSPDDGFVVSDDGPIDEREEPLRPLTIILGLVGLVVVFGIGFMTLKMKKTS